MSKQERAAKRKKQGTEQAERIIDSVYATALERNAIVDGEAMAGDDTPDGLEREYYVLACEVKVRRDNGETWMQIGAALGLPGAKSGAGAARKLWRYAFGDVPRVQHRRTGAQRQPQNEHVAAVRSTPKAERVESVRNGEAVLPETMSDEDIISAIDGRAIGWSINVSALGNPDHTPGPDDAFAEQTADVCHGWVYVDKNSDGDRVVVFKESAGREIKWRRVPGMTRVVRVSAIHTIGAAVK